MAEKKFRIVHLIASNFYGGPEKQIVEHLKILDRDRFQGVVGSFLKEGRPNAILEKASEAGLKTFGIEMSGPLDFRAQHRLNTCIEESKTDLLCAHGYKSAVMGWWAGHRFNIPVLVFSRGYTAEDRKVAFYEWLERRVLERVTGVVTVSHGQKKKLEKFGIKPKKSWVVHNAVSVKDLPDEQEVADLRKRICTDLNVPSDARFIVSAGRLSPEKGHRFFVDAISLLKKSEENVFFIFCGDGPCLGELEQQARRLGVYQKCRFVGFRNDMVDISQCMEFMVLPSLTEGLPNVVLESFSHAKPVVAASVGGVPEIVADNVNGFLFEAGRSDLLAEAMDHLLSSPQMGREMGLAGYKKVKTEFSFAKQCQELQVIYLEVLESDSSSCENR